MMRRLIVAGTVLALATGVTTTAMASDHKADKSGSHVGRFHTAAFARTHHLRRSSRLAGAGGPESWYPGGGSPGYHGGFIDLGPLGIRPLRSRLRYVHQRVVLLRGHPLIFELVEARDRMFFTR
jgi:hypothetical protein